MQSATLRTLVGCMPASEGPISDPLGAFQANTAGCVRLLGAEHDWSHAGQLEADSYVAHSVSQEKEPRQQPKALKSAAEGVELRNQPKHAEHRPARHGQKGDPAMQLSMQSFEDTPHTPTKADRHKHTEDRMNRQEQGAPCSAAPPKQETEGPAHTSTWQGMPAHAIRSSQPGTSTATAAVRSRWQLRTCLALSKQPHQRANSRAGTDKHFLDASSCRTSSSEREAAVKQCGRTMTVLHGPLREKPFLQRRCAPGITAGPGGDEACQPSVSMGGRTSQCSESKHTGVTGLRSSVQSAENPGMPSLSAADTSTIASCMVQIQQRERRQFTPSSEEAAPGLDSQLWRRRQRRRNGVQHLWDKAEQVKDIFDKGGLEVQH